MSTPCNLCRSYPGNDMLTCPDCIVKAENKDQEELETYKEFFRVASKELAQYKSFVMDQGLVPQWIKWRHKRKNNG